MSGYFRRPSSTSFGLISSPVGTQPCRRNRSENTPEPQPRSATRSPDLNCPSSTEVRISSALLSGANTSYESAAAWLSKNVISFCLSCCLSGEGARPTSWAGGACAGFCVDAVFIGPLLSRDFREGQSLLRAEKCNL